MTSTNDPNTSTTLTRRNSVSIHASLFDIPIPCGSTTIHTTDFQYIFNNTDPFLKSLSEHRTVLSYKCLILTKYLNQTQPASSSSASSTALQARSFVTLSLLHKIISTKRTLCFYNTMFNKFCQTLQDAPMSPTNMTTHDIPLMFFWTTSVSNAEKKYQTSRSILTIEYGYMDTVFEKLMLTCLDGCLQALFAIHYTKHDFDLIQKSCGGEDIEDATSLLSKLPNNPPCSLSAPKATIYSKMACWIKAAKIFEQARTDILPKWTQLRAADYICDNHATRMLPELIPEGSDRYLVDLRDRCLVGYILNSCEADYINMEINNISVPVLYNNKMPLGSFDEADKVSSSTDMTKNFIDLSVDEVKFKFELYVIKAKMKAALILRDFKHNQSTTLHFNLAACLRREVLLMLVECWADNDGYITKTPYILAALGLALVEDCSYYDNVLKALVIKNAKNAEAFFEMRYHNWLFLEQIPYLGAITRQHVQSRLLGNQMNPFLSMVCPILSIKMK
jgi:hypothetical protein